MHLIRLLIAGIHILREGEVPVRMEDALRDKLLAIKRGEMPWDEVEAWRLGLHREFDRAHDGTTLPDKPDIEMANRLLIQARRSML